MVIILIIYIYSLSFKISNIVKNIYTHIDYYVLANKMVNSRNYALISFLMPLCVCMCECVCNFPTA